MDPKSFYESMYGENRNADLHLKPVERRLSKYNPNRYALVLENLGKNHRILDLGCGDGELLIPMRASYQEVWGLDISRSRLDRVETRIESENGIYLMEGDINTTLNFADKYFDTITIVAVLEHVFDPYSVLRECCRLLRPGGTLMVYVPNVAILTNRMRLLFGRLPVTSRESGWDGGHLHYFTEGSLKKLFSDTGFQVRRVTAGGYFAKLRRWWLSLLCPDMLVVGVKKNEDCTSN